MEGRKSAWEGRLRRGTPRDKPGGRREEGCETNVDQWIDLKEGIPERAYGIAGILETKI